MPRPSSSVRNGTTRAVDLEMPHALTHLVRSGPQLVRDGEMASLLNADSVVERFLGARLLAWQEQDAAMLEVVAEMFSLEAIRDQIVPAAALIDLALYCVELGRPSSASSLVQVLTEHFAKFQDENQVLRGDLSIRWALLRELVGLGSTIPPRQLAKVAQALHGDSPEAINDAASDLLQSRGLAKLDETRRLLHLYAPALAKVLNRAVDLPGAHGGSHGDRLRRHHFLPSRGLLVPRTGRAPANRVHAAICLRNGDPRPGQDAGSGDSAASGYHGVRSHAPNSRRARRQDLPILRTGLAIKTRAVEANAAIPRRGEHATPEALLADVHGARAMKVTCRP